MKHLLYLPILCLSLLFSQTEIETLWTFTNCGQEGRFGPELGQCESEYSGTSLEGQITMSGFQGYQEWTVTYSDDPGSRDEYTFSYTGGQQIFNLEYSGIYMFQVYGASGGTQSSGSPGLGGYAEGSYALNEGDLVYIFVGGQGESSLAGYNGGGSAGSYSGGGGGASDIRLGGTSLYDRIIVAAGGGGAAGGTHPTNAGDGGGLVGQAGDSYGSYTGGGGGTQESGGTAGSGYSGSEAGGFGYGGGNGSSHNPAGGGGWYGGGSGAAYSSGGGGSILY